MKTLKAAWLDIVGTILTLLALLTLAAALPGQQDEKKPGQIEGKAELAFKGTGYIRPSPEKRAKAYRDDRLRNGGRVAQAVQMVTAPAQYDAVALGFVPPIVDQGNCGSCYGVATADQLTAAFCGAGYQKADGSFEINFQFGLDRCGPDFGGCNGGWGLEVAEWMMANGFPAERWIDASGKTVNDYPPYEARPRQCRERAGAKRWKPNDFGLCSGSANRAATVAEIKACLLQFRSTINIAFNANSAYSNAGPNSVVRVTGGANHETTLVGWDDSKNGGKGAWKTRGNWGKGLGDQGYVWMTYDSHIEDPFWMTATSLPPPPPPPPPDPFPPFPPGPTPAGAIFTLDRPLAAGSYQIVPLGTLEALREVTESAKKIQDLINPPKAPDVKPPEIIEEKKETKEPPMIEEKKEAKLLPDPAWDVINAQGETKKAPRIKFDPYAKKKG